MTATLDVRAPWANLSVPAPDGTHLATDVHVPPPETWPVPTVVTRTPYGRSGHLAEGRGWRARGFAYAVQDVRGRYDSDGTWRPYRDERADGAALADWLVAQPWSDGRLVAYGGSYAGYTAWTLAVERPELVVAVVSLGPSMGLHRTKYTPSGILRLAEHAAWWLERADGRTSRDGLRDVVFAEDPEVLAHLPVAEIGGLLGARLPHWADTLALHPHRPPAEAVADSEVAAVRAATLHVAGWYDLLLEETVHLWRLAGGAHTPPPRRDLLLGPWGHDLGLGGSTTVGHREHGPAARRPLGEHCVRWLREVLEGGAPRGSGAEVFVVGAGEWARRTSWPPEDARRLVLATDAGGALGGEPRDGGEVGWDYDPLDPFPSALPGTDRSHLLARVDAARFAADLNEPLHVEGVPQVRLVAETTGDGADWVLRLLERTPEGRLFELATGTAVADGPGALRAEVPLTPLAVRLPARSALVLEVTSSDFPYLARHLATGPDRHHGRETAVARQAVRFGAGGTELVLPVLDAPERGR